MLTFFEREKFSLHFSDDLEEQQGKQTVPRSPNLLFEVIMAKTEFLVSAFQVTTGWSGEEEEKGCFTGEKKDCNYDFQGFLGLRLFWEML